MRPSPEEPQGRAGSRREQPVTTDDVRRHNSARVLRLLRDHGPASRAEVARETDLAKATVGAIVGTLLDAGVLAEAAPARGEGRGRPSVPLALDGRGLAGIGLEVNVDYTAVTVLDLAGRELWFEEATRHSGPLDVDAVTRLAVEQVRRVESAGLRALGLTLAVPGLVDRGAGRVLHAPNLGWRDLALREALHAALGGREDLTLAVDNDANCAARAEVLRGAAVGVREMVYLTGTVGLGAGILAGGQVLRGARGLAGEVGHLRVGGHGECRCGRTGCWEVLAGQRGLVAASGLPVDDGEDPVAYATRVAALPDAGSRLAPVVEAMTRGVSALALGLDPQLVVLGGAFVPLGRWLQGPVEAALAHGVTGPGTRVALSILGLHAASLGAALDALEDVFAGRRALP